MGTHFNLAMVYKDLNKNKKSLIHFEKSLQVNPSLTEAHYRIAQIYLSTKNFDQALKSIEKAVKISPSNLKYQETREQILFTQNK
jgi:rhomboid protease GluP